MEYNTFHPIFNYIDQDESGDCHRVHVSVRSLEFLRSLTSRTALFPAEDLFQAADGNSAIPLLLLDPTYLNQHGSELQGSKRGLCVEPSGEQHCRYQRCLFRRVGRMTILTFFMRLSPDLNSLI